MNSTLNNSAISDADNNMPNGELKNLTIETECVVCFKNTEIYSIGECDHPVCFECSTRMRVLCGQNECPICRQNLSKVIFTNEKRSYKELEMSNRSEFYNKKYKIAFCNNRIKRAFYNLLDLPCNICNCPPFYNFESLRDHVRREHEMFYCDICTEHLKIFSFERKCYTRQELGMHRRKGDIGQSAHRGHPLCQYCDERYLDNDELFRHLRREHFFCHFCDADGSNQFYGDYNSLREHFNAEHYLCEEGDCNQEKFTSVFRTDIDLRAHIANVHGKSLNKLQAKQARTLQLDITLGPRAGRSDQNAASLRSRSDSSQHQQLENQYEGYQQQIPKIIDAKNEQEFPSLGGPSSSISQNTNALVNHSTMIRRFGQAGLARTKENFPALGGSGNDSREIDLSQTHIKSTNSVVASSLLKPSKKPTQNPVSAGSMVIHISNRPTNQIQNQKEFPALPMSLKQQKILKLNEDMPLVATNNNNSFIAAKHRILVEDYVSVANPASSAKIQLIQTNQENNGKNKQPTEMKLKQKDFPALAPAVSVITSQPVWVKSQREKNIENRKSKVAPAPDLKSYREEGMVILTKKSRDLNGDSINNNNKKVNKNENKNDFYSLSGTKQNKSVENKSKPKSNKNSENNCNDKKQVETRKVKNDAKKIPLTNNSIKPPPGFECTTNLKIPPGFQTVTVNSIAKSVNNLTFETSLGEKYSIVPHQTNSYIPPFNNFERNKELINHFYQALNQSEEAVKEFKYISQKFREGIYKPLAYYEHCEAALGIKFDEIFPELLALLPDISKQQELYLIHIQNLKKMKQNPKKNQKLEVCSSCKQVLKSIDYNDHLKLHNLDNNFPSLRNK